MTGRTLPTTTDRMRTGVVGPAASLPDGDRDEARREAAVRERIGKVECGDDLLCRGCRGPEIEVIQRMINDHRQRSGLPPIEVDGVFGRETDDAVRAFQGATAFVSSDRVRTPGDEKSLPSIGVDGLVGPITIRALLADNSESGVDKTGLRPSADARVLEVFTRLWQPPAAPPPASPGRGGERKDAPESRTAPAPARPVRDVRVDDLASKYGAAAIDVRTLGGEKVADARGDVPVEKPASTIKLAVADVVLRKIRAGELSLDEALPPITPDVKSSTDGKLGERITVKEGLRRMLSESDNTVTNAFVKRLGGQGEGFGRELRESGYDNVRFDRYLAVDSSRPHNVASAADIGTAMTRIFEDESEAGRIARKALEDATFRYEYPGRNASKYGLTSSMIAESGVVEANGKRYVVTAFFPGGGNVDARKAKVGEAMTKVYERLASVT